MNTFNVDLTIQDCTYSCNCKNCCSNNVTVTNSSQTINLQNDYLLNVLAATNTYATVLIQNGFQVIIRNVRNYPMQICIPTKNCTHVVTLCATINEAS